MKRFYPRILDTLALCVINFLSFSQVLELQFVCEFPGFAAIKSPLQSLRSLILTMTVWSRIGRKELIELCDISPPHLRHLTISCCTPDHHIGCSESTTWHECRYRAWAQTRSKFPDLNIEINYKEFEYGEENRIRYCYCDA